MMVLHKDKISIQNKHKQANMIRVSVEVWHRSLVLFLCQIMV